MIIEMNSNKNNRNEESSLNLNENKNNKNENLNNSHDSNRSDFSFARLKELSIQEKIKITAFMMISVAVLRIFSFEIFVMLGELISSIIVFLYSLWNNKCMAILVAINGISGFVYSFISIIKNLLSLKSENFGYVSVINLMVAIFSTLVYACVIYLAHYGLKHFELLKFGKHEDRHKEKDENEGIVSEYGAIGKDKDINNSFSKADTLSIKKDKKNPIEENKESKDNGIFDNFSSLGVKAKEAGENVAKLKNGIDMVGEALDKLGKK